VGESEAPRVRVGGSVSKLSIKDFHRFMRGPFVASIKRAFKSHQIFCEADLQSFAWRKIKNFLERHEEAKRKFRVLNKPFLRDCGTYPDLVVFRRKTPWVVIELKESKMMKVASAGKERKKLLQAKKVLHPKRGYLVYVARNGERRVIQGPKGKGGYYFFEVPIILEQSMSKAKVKEWTAEFKLWAKYVVEQL
jgi:hypothetical protein